MRMRRSIPTAPYSSHLKVQLYPETLFCSTFWLFSPPLGRYDNNGFPMILEFDDHCSIFITFLVHYIAMLCSMIGQEHD